MPCSLFPALTEDCRQAPGDRSCIEGLWIEASTGPRSHLRIVLVFWVLEDSQQIAVGIRIAAVLRRTRPRSIGTDCIGHLGVRFHKFLKEKFMFPVIAEVVLVYQAAARFCQYLAER